MIRHSSTILTLAVAVALTACSPEYSGELIGNQRTVDVKVKRFGYDPGIITVRRGETVVLKLQSDDVTHGFYLFDYDIEASVDPGETRIIGFVADKPGRFSFRCSVTCGWMHPYEYGYLRVLPNNRFYAGIVLVVLVAIGAFIVATRRRKDGRDRLFGIIPLDWRWELTKYKPMRALFKSRWFPAGLILVNMVIFGVILFSALVGGVSAGNLNFGVMITWVLWWVLLMTIFVPIAGRFWCLMCPFPLIGDWIQRGKLIGVGRQKSWGLNKKWPKKFRNLWPLTLVFFVTTLFFGFFTVIPIATFALLVLVVGTAIAVALIYEKRTFCLYICPVSGFQGLYANFAAVEVRAKDLEVCKAHRPKTCYVGNENGYGCPWLEHPYDMNRNTYCGLCMECFKSCPYDNMAFNIRPFGTDLLTERKRTDEVYNRRSTDEAFKGLTMVGILIVFFLVMQGPYGLLRDMVRVETLTGYWLFVAAYTLTAFAVIPGLFLGASWLSKLASGVKDVPLKKVFVDFSYCLIPLGIARWAAFSVAVLFVNGSYVPTVLSDPLSLGWDLFGTARLGFHPFWTGAIPYIQTVLLLLGLVFSVEYGYRFAERLFGPGAAARRGWIPMFLFLVALSISFLWLFEG